MTDSADDPPAVLYVGLRRSALEWRAELDAAAVRGLRVRVASDTDLSHTGLPDSQLGSFDRTLPIVDQTEQILPDTSPSAVICWGDKHVGLTARVAERCGARGIGTAAADVVTDKAAQRDVLQPHGLNPPWRAGRTLRDLRDIVAELGGPDRTLVFKSAHCSGGRGMALIEPGTSLADVFALTGANYARTTDFLVEEYVGGSEHSVSGVVSDGAVRILGVADKTLDGPLRPIRATTVPTTLRDPDRGAVEQAARRAVLAAGIRTGGWHVDLRSTPDGPVVLEVGGRLGGDLINSHLIPYAHQGAVRPYDTLLALLTDGEFPAADVDQPTRGAAMVLLGSAAGGAGELAETVLAHPRVVLAEEWPGTDGIAAVVVTDDPTKAAAVVADLREWVR